MTAQSEGMGMGQSVNDIGGKDPTEEHDLGDQKDPDTQIRGFPLLFERVEMMLEPPGLAALWLRQLSSPR